jgi:hypothetical protein
VPVSTFCHERFLLYPFFNSTYSWHSIMWHLRCVTLTAWFNKWWLIVKKIRSLCWVFEVMFSVHKEMACIILVPHPRCFNERRLLRPCVKFCVNATFIIDDKCVCVSWYLSEFTFHFISKNDYPTRHRTHSASKSNDFWKSLCI